MSRAALLAIARAWLDRPGAAEDAGRALRAAAGNPAAFAAAARAAGLAPVALEIADRLGAPGALREELSAAAQADAARALALEASAGEMAEAALARGLAAVLVKGAALGRRYPGGSLRPFADLDLLIKPGELAAWGELLPALGYAPAGGVDRSWRGGALDAVDLHAKSSDLIGVIDVPEELSPVRLDLSGMFARSARGEGLPFPALCAEDELVLAAGHGLGVHAFERMIWLVDVAVLAAGPLDVALLAEVARDSGASRFVYHALEVAGGLDLLGVERTVPLEDRLRPARVGRLERRLIARLAREGLPDRAEYLLALAMPAPRGYKATLLRRALLPRRRAYQAAGGSRLGGALRHAGALLRLGALALGF